jgi:hypothetical protein
MLVSYLIVIYYEPFKESKVGGGVSQVVERLLSKYEALHWGLK